MVLTICLMINVTPINTCQQFIKRNYKPTISLTLLYLDYNEFNYTKKKKIITNLL
jgi:hypothetical protein